MERYKLEIVNDHGDRYIRCEPATDGSWVMFKDVEAQAARIKELECMLEWYGKPTEAAVAIGQMIQQAKRDALAEAARRVEIMWLMFREKDNGASDWIFRAYDDIPTGDDVVAAIRALGGGKMSDDLVERLRTFDIYDYADADKICREAAARIAELEAALSSIARNTCCDRCQEAALVARAALEGGKDGSA